MVLPHCAVTHWILGISKSAAACGCADTTDAPEGLQLVARALVRGEGKTEGYHERHVPISRRMRRLFVEGATDEAAALATERVRLAGELQDRVLKPALFTLFQNGADQIDYRDKEAELKAEGFLKRFDRTVDVTFFEDLRDEIDQDDRVARDRERAAWVKRLLDSAAGLLREAEASASRSTRRRFRASVRATDRFYGTAYRNEWLKPYLAEAQRDVAS
jgi:CRISPR system Cascade subunit CasA